MIDPAPAAPTYDALMVATHEQQEAIAKQAGPITAADKAWAEIMVPEGLGLTATGFKWKQNLSHVDVFVRLPASTTPKQVGPVPVASEGCLSQQWLCSA
eukprot:GHRR01032670.1.p1 GENE.GHRR01032670.1~~GHRR01032670.1.p1  ORF type:complete len:112 (-),score=41.62 GHRR01032670.1:534-830(-)